MTGLETNPITTFSISIYIRSKLVQYVVNEGCSHHELSNNTCFSIQTLLNLWHEHFLYGPMFLLSQCLSGVNATLLEVVI